MKLLAIASILLLVSPLAGLIAFGHSQSLTLDTINPIVVILSPEEGDNWVAGMENGIIWEGTDTNLTPYPVQLLYSQDGGMNWQTMEEYYANTGLYNWMTPYLESNQVLVRIVLTDSFGNTGEDLTDGFFSIVIPFPASPRNVRLEVINGLDISISWEAVTEDVQGNPLIPDGYIVLYSPTFTDMDLFSVLAATEANELTHESAAVNYSSLFYIVLAYKDIDPATAGLLRKSGLSSRPMYWRDIKTRINTGKP